MKKVLYKIDKPRGLIAFNYIYGHINTKKQATNYAWYIVKKGRAHHGIIHIESDTATIEFEDGIDYTFSKGNLVYIPKGTNYKILFNGIENCTAYTEQVNYLAYDKSGNEYYLSFTPMLLLETTPPEIVDKMRSMYHLTLSRSTPKYPISSLFFDILDQIGKIISKSEIKSTNKRCVAQALEYINDHLNESYPIYTLSDITQTSESYLRKLFKEETGLTPIEYKNKRKVQKIVDLLKLNPQISTLSLIENFDFYDQSYFYKLFKRHTGLSFSKFRKTLTDINTEKSN